MARVRTDEFLEILGSDLSRALERTADETIGAGLIDRRDFYREFLQNVRRTCSEWAEVPDDIVEKQLNLPSD